MQNVWYTPRRADGHRYARSVRLRNRPHRAAIPEFVHRKGNVSSRWTRGDLRPSDREAVRKVLSRPENVYIARELCWLLTIDGNDAYVVIPRDNLDLLALIESLRPTPRATDVDILVGVLGVRAPPSACNGVTLPTVLMSRTYSFDIDSFVKSLPRPEKITDEQFNSVTEEAFGRILQLGDNLGTKDEHRGVNYLATRYPAIYVEIASRALREFSLSAVDVKPSSTSAVRNIFDVVFSFTDRRTDFVDRMFARVDATELFPFWSPSFLHTSTDSIRWMSLASMCIK